MISVILQYLVRLPHFFALELRDLYIYIKTKGWLQFDGWGLHLYVGQFGAGKTCSMVQRAHQLARRYPSLTIVTNLQLSDFPEHTTILPLLSPADILNAPDSTLVLIDEIGTIFNSRDFSKSKESVPKILFQHLCQCRKRRMQILATTQRWGFLDKQLRDICATVRVTKSHFVHPFTRICTVYTYDAVDYDHAYGNPLIPCRPLAGVVYVQTDALRCRYDTAELIDNMLRMDYVSDADIAANRGDLVVDYTALDKSAGRKAASSSKRYR